MSADETPSSETGVSGLWSRLFRGRADEVKTRQGIAEFLAEFRDRGVLAPDELAMLQGVLDVSNTQVRDIMVPRSRWWCSARTTRPTSCSRRSSESNHSRFPVIGDDRDEVVGIVLAKDMLKHFVEDDTRVVRHRDAAAARGVHSREQAPEHAAQGVPRRPQPHGDRRRRVRRRVGPGRRSRTCSSRSSARSTTSTTSDEAATIQPQDDGRYHRARARRGSRNSTISSARRFSDEEYDTVGGLVMHELGRMPRRGEQLDFAGFRFKVLRGDRRRLHTLEVTRAPAPAK